jgi:hypothetical protein
MDATLNKQWQHVYAEEPIDEDGNFTIFALGGFVPDSDEGEMDEFLKASPYFMPNRPKDVSKLELAAKENEFRLNLIVKMTKFLTALKATGCNVSKACTVSGLTKANIDSLRLRSGAFGRVCDDVYESVTDDLEEAGLKRAVEGVDEPVYWRGVKVGTKKAYSDAILTMMLQGRRPNVYKSRAATELTGANGGPVQTEDLGWAKDRLADMLARRVAKNEE